MDTILLLTMHQREVYENFVVEAVFVFLTDRYFDFSHFYVTLSQTSIKKKIIKVIYYIIVYFLL